MTDDMPMTFGKYRLYRRFSGAGMSEVFLAENTEEHGRPVVVKRLPALLSPDSRDAERIRAEARQWAQIGDHPHIVSLFGTCEIENRFCLEMEYVEGRDLGKILREQGALSPPRAVRIVAQVARALHKAHEGRLLHRDVKPANILVYRPDLSDRDEEVHAFLADFGIARREAETQVLTAANQAIGTIAYMAPERFEDPKKIESDCRVDVYGLACVLYECLTGDRAIRQDIPEMVAWAHRHDPRPQPSSVDPGLAAFDAVLRAGLAVDREARPKDTIAFKEQVWAALERWEAEQLVPAPPPTPDPVVDVVPEADRPAQPDPGPRPPEPDRGPRRPRVLAGSPVVIGPAVGAAGAGAAVAAGAGGVSAVIVAALGLAAGAFGALGFGGSRRGTASGPPDSGQTNGTLNLAGGTNTPSAPPGRGNGRRGDVDNGDGNGKGVGRGPDPPGYGDPTLGAQRPASDPPRDARSPSRPRV